MSHDAVVSNHSQDNLRVGWNTAETGFSYWETVPGRKTYVLYRLALDLGLVPDSGARQHLMLVSRPTI